MTIERERREQMTMTHQKKIKGIKNGKLRSEREREREYITNERKNLRLFSIRSRLNLNIQNNDFSNIQSEIASL